MFYLYWKNPLNSLNPYGSQKCKNVQQKAWTLLSVRSGKEHEEKNTGSFEVKGEAAFHISNMSISK